MEKPVLTFATERLLLRPTDETDAAFLLELLNSPKWLAFIGDRQVYTLEDARNYVREKIQPQLLRLGYSNYTLLRRADGARLGCCGLYDREGLAGIDLGFALLPAFEGQGYAYEASRRLLSAGWEDFQLPELSAITTPDNLSSQRLLTKLGFSPGETVQLPGDDEVVLHYRITRPQ